MSNKHVVACLWMIAMVLALGWVAGLVSIREARLQWSHVDPTYTHPKKCPALNRGAFCQ